MNFSLIKSFINKISDDDIFALSAQFSYYIILGIFPFIFLFVIFLGYYSNLLFDILYEIKHLIPAEIYSLFLNLVTDSVSSYKSQYFSASIIVLLWSASSGSVGIIKGINKAYDTEIRRNYIFLKIFGLLFTLALMISFQIVLVFIVIGKYIIELLITVANIPNIIVFIVKIIRYAFPVILLIVLLSLVYKFIPNKKIKFSKVLPGAFIATFGCLTSSICFSIYVNLRSTYYNNIYGNLSGIFILLLWIYMTGFIFLLGNEINAFFLKEEITFKKFFHIK